MYIVVVWVVCSFVCGDFNFVSFFEKVNKCSSGFGGCIGSFCGVDCFNFSSSIF